MSSATPSVSVARGSFREGGLREQGGADRRSRFADVLARAGGRPGSIAPKRQPPAQPSPKAPLEKVFRPRELSADDPQPGGSPPGIGGLPNPGQAPPVDAPGAVELRAAVRAAPPVIAAALRPDCSQLALSFGAALSLDLRTGTQGLELTLRPAQGLERVTRAELPGLVEALRAQGLRVARAEVRARAGPGSGPGPRAR